MKREMLGVDYGDGHDFAVELHGWGSRVKIDGVEMKFVRSVKVDQPLDGPPTVTVEFLAKRVTGIDET